ncbi:hypothetical protein NC652_019929 [Populus alba x Populus x berolinensis]|nr:hypothetical protein NC652_019929 [Populus alba x Populus x berolinensis]
MSLCLLHGDATEIFLSFSTLIFVNKETYLSHLEVNVMIPRVTNLRFPPERSCLRGGTRASYCALLHIPQQTQSTDFLELIFSC